MLDPLWLITFWKWHDFTHWMHSYISMKKTHALPLAFKEHRSVSCTCMSWKLPYCLWFSHYQLHSNKIKLSTQKPHRDRYSFSILLVFLLFCWYVCSRSFFNLHMGMCINWLIGSSYGKSNCTTIRLNLAGWK